MYLSLEAYAAGWVSGIANVLVGHPFDTGKVRRQAGLKSKYRFSNLGELLHRLRFVYRGVTGPVLTVGALLSINFGTWRSCKDALEATERGRSYGYGVDFISGVFSGGFCAQIVFPLQCIKVRAQTIPEPKLTFRESFRDFCKTSSYRSTIARGYVPHLLQESVGRGLYMVTYQILTDKGCSLNTMLPRSLRECPHPASDDISIISCRPKVYKDCIKDVATALFALFLWP